MTCTRDSDRNFPNLPCPDFLDGSADLLCSMLHAGPCRGHQHDDRQPTGSQVLLIPQGNYLPPLSATFVEAVNGLFLQGDGDCDERVVSARCHGLEVA